MRRRALFAAGSAAVAAGAAVGFTGFPVVAGEPGAGNAAMAVAPRTLIPDTAVVDQDGQAFRFHRDLLQGKVALINFFYTSCGETCPLVSENLRAVQDLLGDRMGRDIFLYSVSLQPELETPAVLKDYAEQWAVKPGWKFLTGRPDEIERLRVALGFASADPAYDRVKDNHTGMVRYVNEPLDRWGGVPGLSRPAWIAKAVSSIAPPPAA